MKRKKNMDISLKKFAFKNNWIIWPCLKKWKDENNARFKNFL